MADNTSTNSPHSELGSPFSDIRPPSPACSQISQLSVSSGDSSAVGGSGLPDLFSEESISKKSDTQTFHSAEEQLTEAGGNPTETESVVLGPDLVSGAAAAETAVAPSKPLRLKRKDSVRFTEDTKGDEASSAAETTATEVKAKPKVTISEVEVSPHDTANVAPESSSRFTIDTLAEGIKSLYAKSCYAVSTGRKMAQPWLSSAWSGTTNKFSNVSSWVSDKYTSMGGPTAMESLKKGASSLWTGISNAAAWTRDSVGPIMSLGWKKGKDLYSGAPSMSQIWNDGPKVLSDAYESTKTHIVKGYDLVGKVVRPYWNSAAASCDNGKKKAD